MPDESVWWRRLARSRAPDLVIGGLDYPYLRRWHILRTPLAGCYLHQFLRSDDERALHDHPYLCNLSLLLEGEYVEHTIGAGGIHGRAHRKAGDRKFRWGPAPHRIELTNGECWTLFLTGPRVREWGFYCTEKGWIPWQVFTKPGAVGEIGRGCD